MQSKCNKNVAMEETIGRCSKRKAHQDGLREVAAVDAGCQERLDDLVVQVCAQRGETVKLHLQAMDTVGGTPAKATGWVSCSCLPR